MCPVQPAVVFPYNSNWTGISPACRIVQNEVTNINVILRGAVSQTFIIYIEDTVILTY
jgi:hypothetical protein